MLSCMGRRTQWMRGLAYVAGCQWLLTCTFLILLLALQAESISPGHHGTRQCSIPLYISLDGAAGGSAGTSDFPAQRGTSRLPVLLR